MRPRSAAVLLSVTALFTSCRGDPTGSASPGAEFASGSSGPSASGHVERDLPEFGVLVEKYSFNAHDLGDGSVGGRFNVRDFFIDGSEKAFAKGRVTCFTVEPDGKTARMGGVVEAGDPPEFVGTEAVWTVRDNGEGAQDPEDQGTDLRFGLPPEEEFAEFHCTTGFPPEAFGTFGETERANVQVRP
jgi:hypothetical protein